MKWYKHDPSAALAGMIGLSVEERGAYYTLIDLQYARAPHGDVTDALVIAALAVRPQVWKRLKVRLIALGKIRELNGKLLANRVETEVQTAVKLMANGVVSGGVSEHLSAKIKGLGHVEKMLLGGENHNHNQTSFLSMARQNVEKHKKEGGDEPAGSLATAPWGALARQPITEQAVTAKPPSATSRAELDAMFAGRRANGGRQ